MHEGSRLHRKLQESAEGEYHPEVPLECVWTEGELTVRTTGRADGICRDRLAGKEPSFTPETLPELFPDLGKESLWTVDEIKTTYRPLRRIRRADPVHLAQAKCYAYCYARQNGLAVICVRMTYCNLLTEGIRRFYEVFSFEELENWYRELMEQYRPWAEFLANWQEERTASIHRLPFPHAYREGQRELAAGVYRTIVHGRKLFLEAPTGTGKTITTLFPSVKAVGEHKAERIFYLTAKTVTGSAAENALQQMREKGLRCKSVLLTAREKVCVLQKPDCNPESCPRAAGHFDRINEAMYDLLMHEDAFSRENVARCAEEHRVCPFELALDMSLFSDVVVGDYNYLFDPHAYLRRFFAEGGRKPYIFLVDEAHNLVDRGREMYSARLTRAQILTFRRGTKEKWPVLYRKLGRLAGEWKRIGGGAESCTVLTDPGRLGTLVAEADDEMAGILSKERQEEMFRGQQDRELRQAFLEFYFILDHFRMIYTGMDERYVACARAEGREVEVNLRCMDPRGKLKECMDRGRASVLLSATMLPITYYKALLGGTEEDYEMYAHSVFDPRRRGLYLVRDLTSRYSQRTPENYGRIAACIGSVLSKRHGNYMVFCPSYSFLHEVEQQLSDQFGGELCRPWLSGLSCTVLSQHPGMTEKEREDFLGSFHEVHDDRSLLGLCVLGGIFGEGIDLIRDALIGVFIIGTGIPQIGMERELLKDYFDRQGANGYDYAYRFPGMNKVQQAAGRVIRTGEDVGIVVLMDERFLAPASRRLFPREWENLQVTDSSELPRLVERFWDEWL